MEIKDTLLPKTEFDFDSISEQRLFIYSCDYGYVVGLINIEYSLIKDIIHDGYIRAAKLGHFEIIEYLIKNYPYLPCDRVLSCAVQFRHVNIVKLLLQFDTVLVTEDIFKIAIFGGNDEIIKMLMESPNSKQLHSNVNLFYFAILQNSIMTVKWLIDCGKIDPSMDKNSAYYHTHTNKQRELSELLISDKRVRDNLKINPL